MKKITLLFLLQALTFFGFSQIVINEFCASNKSYIDTQNGTYPDWIELYNTQNSSVDISGYYLTDSPKNTNKWKVPTNTVIAAKGFLLIWADDLKTGLHTNFNLSVDGEFIGLVSPSLVYIDSIRYGIQKADISYGRTTDGAIDWGFFNTSSPNKTNNTSTATIQTTKPLFSLSPGVYTGTQTISISAKSGAKIYYSTDGSTPTALSTEYTSAISLLKTTIVKAIAIIAGEEESDVAACTYFIDEHIFDLPILSISTDPNWLYNVDTGIYILGPNADTVEPYNGANYWLDKEIPMTFQYYSPTGKEIVNVEGGAKIYGGYSRINAVKSMQFKAKSKYGTSMFHYQFFKDKDINEFKNIAIRNSGNDWGNTMFRDAMMQTLTNKYMKIDYQETQHVAFFINGEYYGLEILTEKLNENYVTSNYNVKPEDVDLRDPWGSLNGDDVAWNNFVTYYTNTDLSVATNYIQIKSMMDIDEYIDYMVAELYYSNTDWPGNNMKFWRERKVGAKWRWIMYDTDFGFGIWNSDPCNNTITFITDANGPDWPNPPQSTLLFRQLLTNETFKNDFIQRFAYHLNTSFEKKRVVAIIDSIQSSIQNEMQYHINKWGLPGSMTEWENNVNIMRQFNDQRETCIQNHISDYFSLGGMASVIIKNDTSKGNVFVCQKDIDTLHSGKYFKTVSLPISAVPKTGYELKYWKKSDYTPSSKTTTSTLIAKQSNWNYLDNGTDQGTAWTTLNFDDSNWKTGNGVFGYSENNITTTIDFGGNSSEKYLTTYFRKHVTINSIKDITNMTLSLMRGDGAVIYLNGNEVFRTNMPTGTILYNTNSTGANETDETVYNDFTFTPISKGFVNGDNIIAVEVHQSSITSSDLSFDLGLTSSTITNLISTSTDTKEYNQDLNLVLTNNVILEPVYEKIISKSIETYNSNYVLYPVPLTDFVHISNPGEFQSITFYTIEGSVILKANQSTVSISNLPSGTYIAEIKSDKGVKRILTIKQ